MENSEISQEKQQMAAKIRFIREHAGYTQERFADLLGISVSALKKLESGENQISPTGLRQMSEKMDLPADWILFDKSENAEEIWHKLEGISEEDKFSVMLRLMHYFTETKDTVYTMKEK